MAQHGIDLSTTKEPQTVLTQRYVIIRLAYFTLDLLFEIFTKKL